MDQPPGTRLRVGDWLVDSTTSQIVRGGERVRVEARTMRLLMYLAGHPGQVVSIEELLKEVWPGVIVSSDSVYQAVASLRRLLGDDPREPEYIGTVPRRGYRLVASVSVALPDDSGNQRAAPVPDTVNVGVAREATHPAPRPLPSQVLRAMTVAVVVLALFAGYALERRPSNPTRTAAQFTATAIPAPRTVAVVPFIDLTAGMSHEYLADGLTEEVIDQLSKVPRLRVVAPTSSFYIKGKQIPIPDIARALSATYVLDGSVRKSGTTLRVAARLSRGGDGYIVWSETYDRQLGNMLAVQNDIATEVAKALAASIDSASS